MRRGLAILALACLMLIGPPTVAQPTLDASIAGVPLVLLPPPSPGDTLVVFYTGDGGWAPLDREVAADLNAAGLPVIGVNSLRYFWRRRTPEGAAADLAAVIDHFGAQWGARRIILVGYSFGADALPAIVPQLPAKIRDRIHLLALISIFRKGELQFHFGSWFGLTGRAAYPTAPLVAALQGLPMLCLYGADEIRSACPTLSPALITQVRLPGGHGYNGAYGDIASVILKATSELR